MLHMMNLEGYVTSYPKELSGGAKQKTAISRALTSGSTLLLLDEPLGALDLKVRTVLRYELRRLVKDLGLTAVHVTHDQEEALSISDRVVVMNAGRIEQIGAPFAIYNFPQTTFVAGFVGTLNQLRCTVEDPAAAKLSFDGQVFTVGNPVNAARGTSVLAMLRPEELRFGATEGENHLNGIVERVTFLGSIVRMTVRLGASAVTLDALNERRLTLPKVGESQTISFPAHAVWVLPEG
jgi:putative spermidine/putrescine transport system ATP-binding protein